MKEISEKALHPWGGEEEQASPINSPVLDFEDSFTHSLSCASSLSSSFNDNKYVPLEDSKKYLEGLENRLARVKGTSRPRRESERKQLITALALSREDHTFNFINSDEPLSDVGEIEDEASLTTASSLNSVNPQGTLGAMIRKVAPDKVALSTEELCELLRGDILAKVHESLHTEESESGASPASEDITKSILNSQSSTHVEIYHDTPEGFHLPSSEDRPID